MNIKAVFLFVSSATLLLSSCAPSKSISVIVSNSYDEKSNVTTYSKLPLGSVQIPGKWKKTSTNQVSRQDFFVNNDSIQIAVAINLCRQYAFYKKDTTENAFVNDYYEWDSKYLAEEIKGQRVILKTDTTSQFIICRIHNDKDVDGYFLFGVDKGKFFNLYVTTDKWEQTQKVEFLEATYKNHQASLCCN
jgi:hypothetical protein